MSSKLLIKIELPSGSNIFKNLSLHFLTDDPGKITRDFVLDCLLEKIVVLGNDTANEHIIQNYVCCRNVIIDNPGKWVFMNDNKTSKNIALDPDYLLVIRFHVLEYKEV